MLRHYPLAACWLASSLAITELAAATPMLQFSADGQLTGAQGVVVASSLYDVEFVDGLCHEPGVRATSPARSSLRMRSFQRVRCESAMLRATRTLNRRSPAWSNDETHPTPRTTKPP